MEQRVTNLQQEGLTEAGKILAERQGQTETDLSCTDFHTPTHTYFLVARYDAYFGVSYCVHSVWCWLSANSQSEQVEPWPLTTHRGHIRNGEKCPESTSPELPPCDSPIFAPRLLEGSSVRPGRLERRCIEKTQFTSGIAFAVLSWLSYQGMSLSMKLV